MSDNKLVAKIDLSKNATYIVKDGLLIIADAPPNGFGKQIITWQSGKPSHYDVNYSSKL